MENNTPEEKIHKGLRLRLRIYFVVAVIVLGIAVYHIIRDHGSALYSFIGLLIGLGLGILASRMNKISWDRKAEQVISSFDAIGIIVLLLYVAFEIYRNKIVGQFVDDHSLLAVSFSLLAGVMYGRVIGIRGKIDSIFKEEGITE